MIESELQLEKKLLTHLHKLNYEEVAIHSEEEMIKNFREILNRRNAPKLNGVDLTDGEFRRILAKLPGSGGVHGAARILRNETITIERDDSTQPKVYLNYFDASDYKNNIYQVTNQITIKGLRENRYDVTILINGLPLVQIELKKSGVEINEAFNQIMRYRQTSYQNSTYKFFMFVQMFVVSNRVNTRYFANGNGELNPNFMFHWTDENNQWLNDVYSFSNSLLNHERLHSIIAKYTVFDESEKKMLLMRPYQVYATEQIMKRATESDKNGYVWHTTGSGKTLTSFKTAQLLSREANITKVIFMLDRADLNKQTTDNFKSYAEVNDLLDGTDSTNDLIKRLNGNDSNLVITTIQKMNNAVKRYGHRIKELRNQKIVFIVDEAHRSQFGKQQKEIIGFFENSQWFGFTGTPRFGDNPAADKRTTDDIFDKLLHSYLINDAIRDGNVLGFQIDYMRTIRLYDGSYLEEDEEVAAIDTEELFTSDERVDAVVESILKQHPLKTKYGKYSAMLTVPSKDMAIKYYDTFRKKIQDKKLDLRVATVFTWEANESGNNNDDKKTHSQFQMERIIEEYNQEFGTKWKTDEFQKYANDIASKVKAHTKGSTIDILIVVNMMLTGFDAKKLNTLYVDKNMDFHNLMQAFSRTNRVETKDKPFGQIVSYRNLKKKTDEALRLFGNTDNVGLILQPEYLKVKAEFKKAVQNLLEKVAEPKKVDGLYGEVEQAEFIRLFRQINRVLTRIQGYSQFEWLSSEEEFGMSEQTYNDFRSKYLDLYRKKIDIPTKISVLNLVDFEIELVERDTINVDYIVKLIRQIPLDSNEEKENKINEIRKVMKNSGDINLRSKMELLERFLLEVIPQLTEKADIDTALNHFVDVERERAIKRYSTENDLDLKSLKLTLEDYQFAGYEDKSYLNETTEGSVFVKRKKIDKAMEFIKNIRNIFTIGA